MIYRFRQSIATTAAIGLIIGLIVSVGSARADEEAEVRALIQRNTQGWQRYDPDIVASTYAPDAIWQNPFGVRITGPAELKRFLVHLFSRSGYRSAKDTSPPTIQAVRLLGPDVAVVWSDESSTGQIERGKKLGDRHSHYLQVLRRTSSGWLISDDMIMDERLP